MTRCIWTIFLLSLLLLSGCAQTATPQADGHDTSAESQTEEEGDHLPLLAALDLVEGEKVRVVATTNLVADVVGRIGGDAISLRSLLPPGADPHGYQATPDDLRAINDAHLLFVNGLGLEESLEAILDVSTHAKTVPVNVGVALIEADEEEEAHHHTGGNPHTWWSVAAVEQWTHNIEQSLAALDPAHAEAYAANAAVYRGELAALQSALQEMVGQIPSEQRKLATDHDTLAYFAQEFDFQIVGLVVPSFSSLAEPSAQHLAQLQDQIRAEDVRAIFVGSTVNPRQAQQLAQDLGIAVVPIFTDSLSAADGPAATYLNFMRYNVGAIVDALGEGK